jgi:chromosome segregation ATPase
VLEGQIIMVESENCKLRNALYDAAASFLIICQQAERIEDSDDASEIRHLASSSHQSAIEAIESPREVFAQRIAQLERENAALRGALDAATTSLCAISQHYREKVEKLERENAALREDNLKAHQIACAAGLERDRLRDELAALRHSEENLAATVRGLEFELEKAEKTAALLRGTVEALGDANDRLTIEISGLRKEVRRE